MPIMNDVNLLCTPLVLTQMFSGFKPLYDTGRETKDLGMQIPMCFVNRAHDALPNPFLDAPRPVFRDVCFSRRLIKTRRLRNKLKVRFECSVRLSDKGRG